MDIVTASLNEHVSSLPTPSIPYFRSGSGSRCLTQSSITLMQNKVMQSAVSTVLYDSLAATAVSLHRLSAFCCPDICGHAIDSSVTSKTRQLQIWRNGMGSHRSPSLLNLGQHCRTKVGVLKERPNQVCRLLCPEAACLHNAQNAVVTFQAGRDVQDAAPSGDAGAW